MESLLTKELLNNQLKQQKFFNGEKLGLADIAILPFIRQFAKITPDIFSELEVQGNLCDKVQFLA